MVAVGPPPSRAGSQGAMRSFPVSARPPAPATKISVGSKKADPSRAGDPNIETSVPTGLPFAATQPGPLSEGRRKKSSRMRSSTTPVIDVLMKHGDKPPAALLTRICAATPPSEQTSGWSTALVGERIARDLIQDSVDGALGYRPICSRIPCEAGAADQGARREAVLVAVSRTPIGEDLMYEFGTWAFNSGRRAMQNDVRTALEVSIDDNDLPKILAILPEEVPDLGPIPDGQASIPAAEASAGPMAEAAVESSTGPAAEGTADPSAEPSIEGK
nr:histone-lysine N-methyltransferase SETD1A-like [Ipomoea batatas]